LLFCFVSKELYKAFLFDNQENNHSRGEELNFKPLLSKRKANEFGVISS